MTFVPSLIRRISQEDILDGSRIKFSLVLAMVIKTNGTTKQLDRDERCEMHGWVFFKKDST